MKGLHFLKGTFVGVCVTALVSLLFTLNGFLAPAVCFTSIHEDWLSPLDSGSEVANGAPPSTAAEMVRRGLRTERESACPEKPLDLRRNASYRLQYVPRCQGNASLRAAKVPPTWLPTLGFDDPCLMQLIRRYCTDSLPVPNVIHHVWFGPRQFGFDHFLSFLSVKFHAPCLVLIHADVLPSGALWEFYLQRQPHVLHVKRSRPQRIHGIVIEKVEHQADIARLEATMKYGGIYMDTDTILLRSLEAFRFSSVTLSYEMQGFLSNGLIIAEPGAPFLRIWHESYKDFKATEWAEHSVIMAAKLAVQNPLLVRTLNRKFIGPGWANFSQYIDTRVAYDWSSDFAIHLYTRKDKNRHLYNVSSVLWMNNTVTSVARHVLYGRTRPCPRK